MVMSRESAEYAILEQKLNHLIEIFNEFKEQYQRNAADHAAEHAEIDRLIQGDGNSPGLKDDVLLNTRFRRNMNKFLWIIA